MKPNHIAIIPDGNRRWAKQHGLSAIEGHSAGIDKMNDALKWAKENDVKILSFWAFSTENAKRDKDEIQGLFKLFDKKLADGLREGEFQGYKVNVNFLGDLSLFPEKIRKKLEDVMKKVSGDSEYTLNLFLGYGGRPEIIHAVGEIAKEVKQGKIEPGEIDEDVISKHMYTKNIPDPDLIIRTSGEIRISGFLPWQSVYSELYFSKKLWPDFNKEDFENAIKEYEARKRRFGR